MGPPKGMYALLTRPSPRGKAAARGRLFPALTALSALLTLGGLAVYLLHHPLAGGIYMSGGALDLALVLTARQGARAVRSASYRHRSLQVVRQVRAFLDLDGTGYAEGRDLRLPLGRYRSLRIPAWAMSVGVLEVKGHRSLVLVKGVGPRNEREALRLLRALDGGLFRTDEGPLLGQWL